MFSSQTLFSGQALTGCCPEQLTGVGRDSRLIQAGEAYVAAGTEAERVGHIAQACALQAGVVVSEDAQRPDTAANTAWLRTAHARWAFAHASAARYALLTSTRPLLGVTGTAGKSTTTHCAWWALGGDALGVARIGTIGWHDGERERENPQTTPPPEQLHAFLAGLPVRCPGVVMEVSSHAGDQQRAAGLAFTAMAYTGLGHDHLDYHRTVASYLVAKLRLLRLLRSGGHCIINADDAHAHVVAHAAGAAGAQTVMLGHRQGDARILRADRGWRLRHQGQEYPLPVRLPGDFNAWNAACGALLAVAAGVPLGVAVARLSSLPAVPGRLELLAQQPDTYVDYAHTPEELENMLRAVRREFPERLLVCVFGCGGDRDASKRGPMGCAALLADVAILTTDNSRNEEPLAIADQVIAGLPAGTRVERTASCLDARVAEAERVPAFLVELDRARAIRLARSCAGVLGVVVVAGKGHETAQLIKGRVLPWDDRAFVRSLGTTP